MSDSAYADVPIDQIRRGRYQPRRTFDPDALNDLAETIRHQGVIEPVVLRRNGEGYELVAGERRWRAAQIAGLHSVPAVIRDIAEEDLAQIALIENIQRQDLNAIEEANAVDALRREHGYTQEELASRLGRSRTAIANLLRLLSLTADVQTMVTRGEVSPGAAKTIAGRPADEQAWLARNAVRHGWNVRRIEKEVKRLAEAVGSDGAKPASGDSGGGDQFAAINSKLSEHVGSPARVESRSGGGYRLIVDTPNLDVLEGVFEKLGFRFDGD